MRISTLASIVFLFGLGVSPAHATAITYTDAAIPGLTVTLDNQGLISGTTYDFQLTIATDANYVQQGDAALADVLQSIAFDLSATSIDATLLPGYSGGTGAVWTASDNNQQNNGNGNCGTENFGSTCLQEFIDPATSANNLVLTSAANTYTWDFTLNLLGGSFSETSGVRLFIADLTLKCTGNPDRPTCTWETNKANAKIFSGTGGSLALPRTDPPTGVPEPGSLLLLGTGLVALSARLRRRPQ